MKRSTIKNLQFITVLGVCALFGLIMPAPAQAQDSTPKPTSFDLDEEQLTIEADIPSVDLILSFREIQERNQGMKESFLDEIVESAKNPPF